MPESINFTYLSKRNQRYLARKVVTVANGAQFLTLNLPKDELHRATNVVYMHVHRSSNRCYVGITVQETAARWFAGSAYKQNRRFGPAIAKHTWNAFDSYILAFADTRDELNQAEVAAITAAGGHKSKFTYNLSPGGDTVAENDKPIVGVNLRNGVERKFKSGADAVRTLGLASVDAPMAIARGEATSIKDWWFRFADDTNATLPKVWGEELRVSAIRARLAKKVVALHLETGEKRLFATTKAAANDLGVEQSQVSAVAAGHNRSAGGWWFRFEGDDREPPQIYGQKAGRLIRDKKVFARQLGTDELRVFRNCTVADAELGLHKGAAAAVALGTRTSAGGWWFTYDKNASTPTIYGAALVARARSKPVIAVEVASGKETTYDSAKTAAVALSMSRASISFIISGKLKSVKGYMFRFAD